MQLHQKVKLIREIKKLSQDYIAHELDLNQSQYSSREKGEIPFITNEIIKLSILLETSISDLFDERVTALNNTILIHEKLIQQYELRIKEKDELIEILKGQINISS